MFVKYTFNKSVSVFRLNRIRLKHNMPAILYGDEASPPVRFVMMTASRLGVEVGFHKVDLFSGENKTDNFTKLNPLQKVPILKVEEEVICDSHAIALFLCRKVETQDLYPEEPMLQARIDQMMFFNSGSLFPVDSAIFTDYFAGKWPMEKSRIDHLHSLLNHLDIQLSKYTWLAGDKLTLCDLCCAATVSSLHLLVPISHQHGRVSAWLKKLQQEPYFEVNTRGIQRLKSFVDKINYK